MDSTSTARWPSCAKQLEGEMQGVCVHIYVCCGCCMCVNAAPHSSSAFGVLLSDDIPVIKSSCSLFGCWDRAHVSITELSDTVCSLLFFILNTS